MAVVEKEEVLAMLDQMEAEAAKKEGGVSAPGGSALLCANNENVSAWIEAINRKFKVHTTRKVSLAEMCHHLGRPCIEIWLEVLLRGFELEKQGKFYEAPIWITN